MTNTTMLEQYIENSGYKKSFIAQQIGLTAYSLSRKINNKSEFKAREITALCEILKITAKDKEAIFFANRVD